MLKQGRHHYLYVLGRSLYHIYMQTLVIFIALQIFLEQLSFKPILYELPKLYYESQRWGTIIRRTWRIIVTYIYIYTKSYQWIEWYVYSSIFSQVPHHFMLKYKAQLTNYYEDSVIKP